jgi:hypothetical protein
LIRTCTKCRSFGTHAVPCIYPDRVIITKAPWPTYKALKVDSAYVTACNAQGVYPLAYYPHNQHFLAATATLEGNSKWALYAAEALQKKANKQLMTEPGWGTIQHYYTIPYYVYVKFGKWDDILK